VKEQKKQRNSLKKDPKIIFSAFLAGIHDSNRIAEAVCQTFYRSIFLKFSVFFSEFCNFFLKTTGLFNIWCYIMSMQHLQELLLSDRKAREPQKN